MLTALSCSYDSRYLVNGKDPEAPVTVFMVCSHRYRTIPIAVSGDFFSAPSFVVL